MVDQRDGNTDDKNKTNNDQSLLHAQASPDDSLSIIIAGKEFLENLHFIRHAVECTLKGLIRLRRNKRTIIIVKTDILAEASPTQEFEERLHTRRNLDSLSRRKAENVRPFRLRVVGARLLNECPEYQKLLKDVQATKHHCLLVVIFAKAGIHCVDGPEFLIV